ncbi:MAG: extracellular repeat protein, family, partial [candidate division NC10 bacterium]|nr:extracellular repeat protein, family [candidate division NC10 bacterium]
ELVGSVDTPGLGQDVTGANGLIYVADGTEGMVILPAQCPFTTTVTGSTPGGAPRTTFLMSWPNPAIGEMTFGFDVGQATAVRLQLYNSQGRLVRQLVVKALETGRSTVKWDGRDDAGHSVARGVYLACLQWPRGEMSRRVTLIR